MTALIIIGVLLVVLGLFKVLSQEWDVDIYDPEDPWDKQKMD